MFSPGRLVGVGLLGMAGVAPLAARADRPRVAVIAVADEAADAGALQAQLEHDLGQLEGAEVLEALEVAARIGVATGRERVVWPPSVTASVSTLLDEAQQSYYRGEYDQAEVTLEKVTAVHEANSPVPVNQQVSLHLWYSAVAFARRQRDPAITHARAALNLDPQRTIDVNLFRPSFARFVERVRKQLPEAEVMVVGLPPGAEVILDGHSAGTRATVFRGRHEVVAHAPGFIPVRIDVDVQDTTRLDVHLPVALPAKDSDVVGRVLAGDGPSISERAELRDLAGRLEVDGLVLARPGRAYVWWRTAGASGVFRSDDEAEAQGTWAREQVSAGPPSGLSRMAWGWRLGWRASSFLARRRYVVRVDTNNGNSRGEFLRMEPAGAGVALAGTLEWRVWLIDAEAWFATERLTPLDVHLPDGRATVAGADRFGAAAFVGWRTLIPAGRRLDPVVLGLRAGPSFERTSSLTVEDPLGPLHIVPEHTYLLLNVGAFARVRWKSVALEAGADVAPFTIYGQQPADDLGEVESQPAVGARGGVRIDVGGGWMASLDVSQQVRHVSHTGDLGFPAGENGGDRPDIRERVQMIAVGLKRGF